MVSNNSSKRPPLQKDSQRPTSPASSQQSNERNRQLKHSRPKSKSNSVENKTHVRHLSADPHTSNLSVKYSRPFSSKQRIRSRSVERLHNLSTVCVYTGANNVLKQHLSPFEGSRELFHVSYYYTSIYSGHFIIEGRTWTT